MLGGAESEIVEKPLIFQLFFGAVEGVGGALGALGVVLVGSWGEPW